MTAERYGYMCMFHSQDASSIHSMCAGGYSLKYPKTSWVLMSSTPVTWMASRRSLGIAEHRGTFVRHTVDTFRDVCGGKVGGSVASRISHLSSWCLCPDKHSSEWRPPPHRSESVSLAFLFSRLPPELKRIAWRYSGNTGVCWQFVKHYSWTWSWKKHKMLKMLKMSCY